ncbi:DUF29 domain-containing protein [Thiospirillum jenense]|uniref:DUF29 domain-containing protein n=1 Tax=Thiospirillum jenense TaxID=1653858 RepID=A0A839HKA8_9GAMM|nr:DUF29 domain-containing protein [Thiospirillum jenense]MBB1127158.1 DUF29 domain-containing protein [Thiospirillum jenense]
MTDLATLYQTDYSVWVQHTVELLRARRFDELDIEHLLEELSDMSKSEQRELESRLLVLIAHLLKWQYQYQTLSERWREFDGRSWRATIIEQRKRLTLLLRNSPGLKAIFIETMTAVYADAIELVCDETGLPATTFPINCPYTAEQLLDKTYYPN